jgi:hypothetical protein
VTGRHAGVHGRLKGTTDSGVGLPSTAVALCFAVIALATGQAYAARRPDLGRRAALSDGWSAPGTLQTGCAVAAGPRVAFPSEAPNLPTGPGAIVWGSQAGGCSGAAEHSPSLSSRVTLAPVGASDRPASASARALPGLFSGELAAAGASFGRVTIGAALHGAAFSGSAAVAVLQGGAERPLGAPKLHEAASAVAIGRAYLGDVAVATVQGSSIAVRVERYYSHGFGPARLVPIGHGRVTSLVATMDYRSDVLLAWQQSSAIYAHMLRASGRSEPTQRLGRSAASPQLQALVSDNDHGAVAWSDPAPEKRATTTRTYLDLSGPGVRFGAPRLLASFADPAHVSRSSGSLGLVRLSTENALLAWTDMQQGRYVVRGAPIVAAAGGAATLLSGAGRDAVLAGLAPGPAGEAIALWTTSPGGPVDPVAARTELWAARTFVVPHNRLELQAPAMIAAPGALAAVSVAVDPGDGRALAAWRTQRASTSIGYAVRGRAASETASAASPRRSAARPPRPAQHSSAWLAIGLAAGGAAAASALARTATSRRRRRPGARKTRR